VYHGHNYMKTCVRHSFGDGFILVQCALCMPPVGFVEANYILRRLCRLKHQTRTSRWWWQKRLQLPQHLKAVPVLLLVNRADSSEVDDRRSVIIQNWSSLQRHLRQDNRSVLLLSVCIEAFTARVSASSSVGDIHRSIYSASLCKQFCRWHSSKHLQRESLQAVLSVTLTARVSASSSVGDIRRSIDSASLCKQFCLWQSSTTGVQTATTGIVKNKTTVYYFKHIARLGM